MISITTRTSPPELLRSHPVLDMEILSRIDCSKPVLSLQPVYYTNQYRYEFDFPSSIPIERLYTDLVVISPYTAIDCDFVETKVSCSLVVGAVKSASILFKPGFIQGTNGLLSDSYSFRIQYANDAVSVSLSYTSPISPQRITTYITFSQEMNTENILDFIVVDNGILDDFSFNGIWGQFFLSPKTTGDITITILKSSIFYNC